MSDSWEEDLDRVFVQLRAVASAEETVHLAEMAIGLEAVPAAPSVEANRPPAPGEFHPYYEDHRQGLTNWLDDDVSRHSMLMPVAPVFRLIAEPIATPMVWEPKTTRLQRQRAWGIAPYVGDPFVYTWWSASDEHGRWIAGSATTIHYTSKEQP